MAGGVGKNNDLLGFRPVVTTPCLCYHSSLDVLVVGHVDDLVCVGPRIDLDTFLAKFLGRSICWRSYVLTWTGDVKLVNEALQEWDMSTSNGLETLGMIDKYDVSSHEIAEFMSKEEAAKCRRTAAKLNYLSPGNPMIAFASKEASRSMWSRKQGEEIKLKRILRRLRKRPTTTYRYE